MKRARDSSGAPTSVNRAPTPSARPAAGRPVYFGVDSPPHPALEDAGSPGPSARSPSKLLVCDHRGEGLAARLEPLAAAGFRIQCSRNLRESRALLERDPPDLVVLDPLASGGQVELEQVERLRARSHPLPLLLVWDPSPAAGALDAARVLGAASWDLVRRDASLEEYALRIERLLALAERAGEFEELRYRASHDDRTELLRPRFFQARLAEHFSAAERHGLELALVLIDLDDFGRINKTHDHTVGDLVIARTAESIRSALRTEDSAGRLGGDEFGVLLPYTSPVDAAHVVQRLRAAIARGCEPLAAKRPGVSVTASLGFETFDGSDLDGLPTLRQHAEIALRASKRAGGNRGTYYRLLGAGS